MLLEMAAVVCEAPRSAACEVSAAFEAQMEAWNRGDLEGALSHYWNNADIRWVNRRGLEAGFDAFAEAMRVDFADRARMGRFSGTPLYVEDLGNGVVLLAVDWRIERDGECLMGGVSTQLWRRHEGRWRIVFEHAS